MSEHTSTAVTDRAAGNFTSTARDYDATVRHNIQGAERLAAAVPPGRYDRVLDVGCGTGWSALAMVERFGCGHVTGVDPAQGMLDVFAEKLGGLEGVQVDLRPEDVMSMSVAPASYDAVVSAMAMHWFPDKAGATVAMARALRPGGVLAILCSGRHGEGEFRAVLAQVDHPAVPIWDAAFDAVQRDIPELEGYLRAAGLEVLDIWMERRIRRAPVAAFLERMRVVAGHIVGHLTPAEHEDLMTRLAGAMRAAAGPEGFEYTFTKLFAVSRRPDAG